MSDFDQLLTNNIRFAAGDAKDRVPEIPFLPNKQAYIITCIDPRVDPAVTVAHDVRRIVQSPLISTQIVVSGYIYDIKTGLLTQAVGRTSVRSEA
ncbi:MAG: hypothetical protein WCE30_22625 [Mycobacterium sp.]